MSKREKNDLRSKLLSLTRVDLIRLVTEIYIERLENEEIVGILLEEEEGGRLEDYLDNWFVLTGGKESVE